MQKSITFGLAGLVCLIAFVLLIGYRFDALWAGGTGFEGHQTAIANGIEYQRGETISTEVGQVLEVTFGSTTLWLDENTEVKLVDGREDFLTVTIVQGRMVVIGDIAITVREMAVNIAGTASIVHYSWLDQLDVACLDGGVGIITDETVEHLEGGEARRIDTFSPYFSEWMEFDASSSSAASFYEQALR